MNVLIEIHYIHDIVDFIFNAYDTYDTRRKILTDIFWIDKIC